MTKSKLVKHRRILARLLLVAGISLVFGLAFGAAVSDSVGFWRGFAAGSITAGLSSLMLVAAMYVHH